MMNCHLKFCIKYKTGSTRNVPKAYHPQDLNRAIRLGYVWPESANRGVLQIAANCVDFEMVCMSADFVFYTENRPIELTDEGQPTVSNMFDIFL